MLSAKRTVITLLGLLMAASVNNSLATGTGLSLAQQNYMLNCQGCHLPDGSGSAGVVPRMTDFIGYFLQVDGGREFIVRVPGAANAPIDDQELADVMNWLLKQFSAEQIPPDFHPYTSEEVGILRKNPLIDVSGVRAGLINRIQDKVGISEDGLSGT